MSTTVRHHHWNVVLLWHHGGPLPIEVVMFLPVAVLLMADNATWITLWLLLHALPQFSLDGLVFPALYVMR